MHCDFVAELIKQIDDMCIQSVHDRLDCSS